MRGHSCKQYILVHDHAITDTHCTRLECVSYACMRTLTRFRLRHLFLRLSSSSLSLSLGNLHSCYYCCCCCCGLLLCRFGKYYKLQEDGQVVQYRDLTKSYGVLFLINVEGEVRHTVTNSTCTCTCTVQPLFRDHLYLETTCI